MALTIKKRCIRCRKYLREDGTCQNPNCVRYTPEKTEENSEENKGENSQP